MIKKAERNERGYVIEKGFNAIYANLDKEHSLTLEHSGYIADNWKKATLAEVAEKTESPVAKMKFFDKKDRYCTAVLDRGFYTIWHDGECIFSEDGDPVAVMDGDGIL